MHLAIGRSGRLLGVGLLLLTACGGDDPADDPGGAADAGAAQPDQGTDLGGDAGEAPDPDSGPTPDGGQPADAATDLGPQDAAEPGPDLRRGDPCGSEQPCAPGSWCDPRSQTCREGCRDDGDCAEDQRCAAATGTCEPAPECADDRYEPNDTIEAPLPLRVQDHELVLCPGNADWFALPLTPLQALRVELEHAPGATLEVLVQPEGGRTLGSARSAEGHAELVVEAAQAGTHLVQVAGDNAERLPYSLRLFIELVCSDDALEPNDEAFEAPAPPAEGAQALTLCPGNEDWYALQVQEADLLQVRISSPGEEPLEATLLNATGDAVLAEASWDGEAGVATLLHVAEATAGVRLRLRSALERGYTLQVTLNPAQECPADALERNDSWAEARALPGGSYGDLVVCRGDEDWYSPELLLWGSLEVFVESPQVDAVSLSLVDVADEEVRVLADAEPEGDGLVLRYRYQEPAAVPVLRASVAQGRSVEYGLRVHISDPPECVDDLFEDNDEPGVVVWPPDEEMELSVCVDDPDWFFVHLRPGDRLRLDLSWEAPEATVALDLLDATGQEVLLSAEPGAAERSLRLVWEALAEATLLPRITVTGTSAADYTFAMQLDTEEEPPPECEDDAAEDNDEAGQALVLDPDPEEPYVLCPEDEDWYLLWVATDETMQVDVSGPAVDAGGLQAELYDAQRQVAAGAASDDGLTLRYTAPLEGERWLRLFSRQQEAGLTYDVALAFEQPEVCADDELEDNDDRGNAIPLEGSPEIVLCAGDEDWFQIFLSVGDRLLLDASFEHAAGNVDLVLYDVDGAEVARSDGAQDDEHLDYTAVGEGEHTLQVVLTDGDRTTCTITAEIDLAPLPECTVDDWEDNDDWEQATVLWGELTEGLTVCADDEDWYSLSLAQGDRITVRSLYDPAGGRVALELYGPWAFPLLSSSLPADGVDQLSATAEVQDNHLLRAWLPAGWVSDYALEVVVEPAE